LGILIVEDERAMSELLAQALTESGFRTSVAHNGEEGLRNAAGHDLLIVDVMMPRMNGFDMVRKLRLEGNRTPVLFLTARDAVSDRVKGLDLGGDDYLIKPFRLEELVARVRALARRALDHQDTLQFGELWLDRRARRARRGERPLYLSNTEFSILELMMMRPGEEVSKEAILQEVWGADEGFRDKNLVEVNIYWLRRKTESMGASRLIQTVRGVGYALEIRESEP
jgi:two-component system response regulator MprA